MENTIQMHEEEILNPDTEQKSEEKNTHNGAEDTGYTPGETEFADGEGTLLDEQQDKLED